MDTTHLEYTAEDLIAHKLQRAKLLIAKPKFDRDGADLIALLQVEDGAKFCRIQCKGRSLEKRSYSNVTVPEEYVTGSFCLFLYIDRGDNATHLYCFFPNEIKEHWKRKPDKKTRKHYYYLYINKETFYKPDKPNNLVKYTFDDGKIDILKKAIIISSSPEEMKLFGLIKMQQELIKTNDKIRKLQSIIDDNKYLKESIKYQNEIIDTKTKLLEIESNKLLKGE